MLRAGPRARSEEPGMRILVVEDEARIRAFLGRAFEAEGFVVDVVADGAQGLERALSGTYDGVILDLLLPRLRLHVPRAGGATSGGGGVLRVGLLALDLTRRQARMGDMVADLADREFRLLHFLMLHPGEVISRQRL